MPIRYESYIFMSNSGNSPHLYVTDQYALDKYMYNAYQLSGMKVLF